MIEVKTGNLLRSDAQALVNTVNCVGVMGKGVALAFKKSYPAMFEDYVARCARGEVRLGRPYPFHAADGHLIVNFPTKDNWRAVSRLSDIVAGLEYLKEHYVEWGIRSLAVPPLGCGNGQLEWTVVGPTLYRYLSDLPIPVQMYAPVGTPPDQMQLDFFTDPATQLPTASSTQTFVEPAWVAIADVVNLVARRRHHWPVGRVRFQKIAYFLSILGVPTKLEYERGAYGPYSAGLKSVHSKLANNGIIEERRRGRMMEIAPGPTFEDARSAFRTELDTWAPHIARVADLVARMPTDEVEIAGSVHMVTVDLQRTLGRAPTDVEVRDELFRWKARRQPPISSEAVDDTILTLAMYDWIDVEPSEDFLRRADALA